MTQLLDVRQLRRDAATSGPWTREQVSTVAVVDLLMLASIATCAWFASDAKTTTAALSWLVVALLALGLSGLTHAMFLLRCRRGIALAVQRVLDPDELPIPASESTAGAPHRLVALVSSTRYHRPDCAFVAGRDVEEVLLDEHERQWRTPCEVCTP